MSESDGPIATSEETTVSWWGRLRAAQRQEVRCAVTDLMALRGLMPLLMKVRNGGNWTRGERELLQTHLCRLSRLSPFFMLLLLPGSVLWLPVYAWWLDRRRRKRYG
ncbi:MAG: hypothetical protein ACRDD3_10295 [Azovibrio sp.]